MKVITFWADGFFPIAGYDRALGTATCTQFAMRTSQRVNPEKCNSIVRQNSGLNNQMVADAQGNNFTLTKSDDPYL